MCVTRADLWACQLKISIKGNAGITTIQLHTYCLLVGTETQSGWKLSQGAFLMCCKLWKFFTWQFSPLIDSHISSPSLSLPTSIGLSSSSSSSLAKTNNKNPWNQAQKMSTVSTYFFLLLLSSLLSPPTNWSHHYGSYLLHSPSKPTPFRSLFTIRQQPRPNIVIVSCSSTTVSDVDSPSLDCVSAGTDVECFASDDDRLLEPTTFEITTGKEVTEDSKIGEIKVDSLSPLLLSLSLSLTHSLTHTLSL